MYYDYFGLNQPPFRITPDTSMFYPGGNRGPILDALIYAILNGEGIVKVVGEVGSGKTMLCRMLEKELPGRVEIVYLGNPSLSPENILHAIAFELKLPLQGTASRLQVMQELQKYLLQRHAENHQVVVFVEEAQGMPIATLEQIRLLSNLETQHNKLLQIVLFGQPELDQRIARREIRQLRERITYSFQLNPFAIDDIRDYLNTRMRACGSRAGEVFSKSAVRGIGRYSRGLIRRINILADKALLAAYAENTHEVTARHVRRAASDSEFVSNPRRFWLSGALGVLILGSAFGALYWTQPGAPVAGPPAAMETMNPEPVEGSGAGMSENLNKGREDVEAQTAALPPRAPALATTGAASEMAGANGALPPDASPHDIVAPEPETAGASPVEAGFAGGESAAEESQAAPAAKSGLDSEAPELADRQLLGMNAIFAVQDLGDPRLSPAESALLQRQLAASPPEDIVLEGTSPASDACEVCWSIIYRPLVNPENL